MMIAQQKGVPERPSVIIPRLFCGDPGAEIEFCTAALGAVEVVRRPGADGNIAHAMLLIGPAMLMIESKWPSLANRAPSPDGSSPVAPYVYVENVDETVARAEAAGARADAAGRSVLGRPHRLDHRSLVARVDRGDAHRRDDGRGAAGSARPAAGTDAGSGRLV